MRKALQDIKIADFTWYVAGPFCTRYLADYGARIIKVESTRVLDGVRPYPPYKDNVPGINRGGSFWICQNWIEVNLANLGMGLGKTRKA